MTIKERQLIFALNEKVKKLTAPVLTTNTPLTGEITPPTVYTSGSTPLPLMTPSEFKGYNPPVK